MAQTNTETPDRRFETLDRWPAAAIVDGAVAVQIEALRAIAPATEALAGAIEAMAASLAGGAGWSIAARARRGLIAQLDAIELPGTFGSRSTASP